MRYLPVALAALILSANAFLLSPVMLSTLDDGDVVSYYWSFDSYNDTIGATEAHGGPAFMPWTKGQSYDITLVEGIVVGALRNAPVGVDSGPVAFNVALDSSQPWGFMFWAYSPTSEQPDGQVGVMICWSESAGTWLFGLLYRQGQGTQFNDGSTETRVSDTDDWEGGWRLYSVSYDGAGSVTVLEGVNRSYITETVTSFNALPGTEWNLSFGVYYPWGYPGFMTLDELHIRQRAFTYAEFEAMFYSDIPPQ